MKSVRRSALDILMKVDLNHAYAAPLLSRVMPHFERRDRRLVVTLVYGTLRWRFTLDWIIGRFSKRPIQKIDPMLLNLLRMGTYQLAFLKKIPPHAAVATSVALAKTVRGKRGGGFVNAVLRRISERRVALLNDLPKAPTVDALALRTSHPPWLVKRWCDQFGYKNTEALCRVNNLPPPSTLRVNTNKISREDLLNDALRFPSLENVRLEPTRFAPHGLRVTPPSAVFDTDWFEKGFVTIQDEASQLVGEIVSPHPGEQLLDACAGIGGKALQLLERTQGDLNLICLDAILWKLSQLCNDSKRLGVSPPLSIVGRTEAVPLANRPIFDKVLLDAPCSNTGVIRRHPERKWSLKREDIPRLAEVQGDLLSAVAPLVKKGGHLIYSTCSLEREEGEEMISKFLWRYREFAIEDCGHILGAHAASLVTDGMLRTFPHRDEMDGFFCASLLRRET